MNQISQISLAVPPMAPVISPLVLCDRLLRLAEDADHAGFPVAAEHLLHLADDVLDPPFMQWY
jgi:hypothetical protein